MPPLDEESRAIGILEGKLELFLIEQKKQGKQIDRIDRKLTTLRIKVGSLAGTVSLCVSIVVLVIKHYFFK